MPLSSTRLLSGPLFRSLLRDVNLVQRRIDLSLRAQQLRQRYFRKCVVNDLMKLDDHRADSAITGMNARLKHTSIALAVGVNPFPIEHSNYLVQVDLGCWSCEVVTTLNPSLRLHKSGFIQDPH